MSLLRSFSKKKMLPILEAAYKESPETFISDLSSLNYEDNISNKTKEQFPYSKVNSVFYDIFLNKNGFVDVAESLQFVLDKGYDLFAGQKTNLISGTPAELKNSSELVSVCRTLIEFPGVEDVLVDYINGVGVDNIKRLFETEKFDYVMWFEKKNQKKLLEIFPLSDQKKQVEVLLGLFNSYSENDRKITGKDLMALSPSSKDELIQKIGENSINLPGKQTKIDSYHTKRLVKFVNGDGVLDALTDKDKSYLLTLIPQKYYYKEMANALKMRFNSKNFQGPPWKSLVIAMEKDMKDYQTTYPCVDTEWSDLVFTKASEEDKQVKVNGFNIYDVVSYIINKNTFFSNAMFLDMDSTNSRNDVDSRVKGLKLSRLVSFIQSSDDIVDSFFDETYLTRHWKNKKSSFLSSSLFIKNTERLIEKFGEDLVMSEVLTISSNESKVDVLKTLSDKHNIKVAKYINTFSKTSEANLQKSKELLMNVCSNAHNWLKPKKDMDFFLNVVTSLGQDYFNELTKNQNTTRSEEFNAAIEKKRLETLIATKMIVDDDNSSTVSSTFKL